MGFQIRPNIPGRTDLLDRRHIEPMTWAIAGSVINDLSGSAMEGVQIKFVDRQTGVEVSKTYTDVNGRFSGKVVQNQAGYRVTPYRYLWGFCPGYYDAPGNMDLPIFRGKCVGKSDPKDEPSK
ncbi:MAG TPA: carboxypeptidase-like regulatory domain-containing protein [Paludibaculum sp.]|jgi:hypothetical protein